MVVNRVAISVFFAALMISLYLLPFAEWISDLATWAEQRPIAGAATYVTCIIIATVLFVTGSGSMMVAGFLFGLLPAVVLYVYLGTLARDLGNSPGSKPGAAAASAACGSDE